MLRYFSFILLAVFAGAMAVHSNEPPPPQTLEQRVGLARLVIVGTAKSVMVMEVKDGELRVSDPQPEMLSGSDGAVIEIEVKEVLYPPNSKAMPPVKYWFGGGFFEVESIRKDTLGRERIYLLKPYEYGDGHGFFFPSWEWHLVEPLEKKPEITAYIEQREALDVKKKAD